MPFKKGNKFQTPGCEHYCAADDLRTPVICRMFRLLPRPVPDTRQLLGQGVGVPRGTAFDFLL